MGHPVLAGVPWSMGVVDAEADTADTDTVADEDTPVDAMIGIVKGSYSGSYSSLRVPIGKFHTQSRRPL